LIHSFYHPLLNSDKTNQGHFGKFLFHLIKVTAGLDFAHKKKMFLTVFAHRKFALWKRCELNFQNKRGATLFFRDA